MTKPKPYTVSKSVRGLFGPWPLPVVNYMSDEMSTALRELNAKESFDIVHFESSHLAAYEELLRNSGLRVTYDWHNIESEALQRYSDDETNPAKRWYARFTVRLMKQLEQNILESAFGHIVCSERERDILLRRAPKARVVTIPNGVDAAHFASKTSQSVWPPRRLIFVGAMDYYANVDAATFFAHQVWPCLHARFPECRFVIVGSNPVPEVLALRAMQGIEVTGTVPDVRQYYANADTAVVPLRLGGGTRLKILEALAAGVPVVSTALGAEGLQLQHGHHLMMADPQRPESWSDAFSALAQPDLREKLVSAGRQFVIDQYDWTVIGRLLCETYLDWSRRTE